MTETEYIYITNMMDKIGLYEMDIIGDYYTWSKKQIEGAIYYIIDRVTGSVDWFQGYIDTVLRVLTLVCMTMPCYI